METVKNWDELTPYQKDVARDQYIYIRSIEDETREDEARERYDVSSVAMREHSFYIDTINNTVFINI